MLKDGLDIENGFRLWMMPYLYFSIIFKTIMSLIFQIGIPVLGKIFMMKQAWRMKSLTRSRL